LVVVAAGQALAGPSQPCSPSNYRLAASIEAEYCHIRSTAVVVLTDRPKGLAKDSGVKLKVRPILRKADAKAGLIPAAVIDASGCICYNTPHNTIHPPFPIAAGEK